ncbi:unnamed protein product [Schistosoma mattheei]|uniref:Egg protein CP391S-like protein n=1 Tax=Schistosoma mattheei TaxID=31246 RepID=A0AA85C0M2_9TREM|nr:unnamed protein product [Schistosoma mattheei]
MRHNFSFGLSISLYLFIVLLHNFLDCQDLCEQSQLLLDEKVVRETSSYKYSYNNYYAQRIRLNQPHPVINGNFEKILNNQVGLPTFPFRYYGNYINHIIISDNEIKMRKEKEFGKISNHIAGIVYSDFEVLGGNEYNAVRMSFEGKINDTQIVAKITNLIYPSGRISIYYENISMEIEESKRQSKISHTFVCGSKDNTEHEIIVPGKWIESSTLVEYEVVGKICSTYNSINACQNSKTSNAACIWCERINVCIDSNDEDTNDLKINDCRIEKVIADVHEETKQNKSSLYLYVIIPLAICLCLLCIGFLIGMGFRRRQRSYE